MMTAALEVLGWIAVAAIAAGIVILVAFIATAVFKAVRDGLRGHDDTLGDSDLAALDCGHRILDRIPDPGEEVWLRIRRCSTHPDEQHVDIHVLPTLRESR
ncbi:hypothetical protein H5399_05270 [Tessaracoccus sp. MC1627]|uniref:hypothetical protein n=1 Tax=Tessaracoccus sp. MC1627 TaxID=2760312 RepID=UPI0015FEE7C3|nr:hypothetical protein [Tessaracoccus sp. MC1627]MBB1512015.1 hypothetical protein [Tessaracoccus sp. MC1627]